MNYGNFVNAHFFSKIYCRFCKQMLCTCHCILLSKYMRTFCSLINLCLEIMLRRSYWIVLDTSSQPRNLLVSKLALFREQEIVVCSTAIQDMFEKSEILLKDIKVKTSMHDSFANYSTTIFAFTFIAFKYMIIFQNVCTTLSLANNKILE